MAFKNLPQKCYNLPKRGKVKETKINLKNKLQQDLERDLLRLFQVSLYCDIKLIVNTSFIFTHSCILQTRAYRFYKFINDEFEVLKQNGISVFNIYNASFTYLQTFVENIYTNFHTVYAEDSIIKHLQEIKVQSVEKNKNIPVDKSDISPVKNTITPETDLFFTPKCSPTDLQKTFGPSKLTLPENNVVSYYKIVSVDDFSADEKLEKTRDKEEDFLLEKELAEQDELLSSFQTILLKKNKTKANSLQLTVSSQSAKKAKPKPYKEAKIKLPLTKSNSVNESGKSEPKSGKNNKKTSNRVSAKPQEKIFESGTALETTNLLYYSDMDISTTGGDSGLDNSSICQPETSPREITFSETSGVDLTESTINDEFPNDETLSAKRPGSNVSSPLSEVGVWESINNFKIGSLTNNNISCDIYKTSNQNLQDNCCEESLNEKEMKRLNDLKKKISDCQMFLHKERIESEKIRTNCPEIFKTCENSVYHFNPETNIKINDQKELQVNLDGNPKENEHNFVFENRTSEKNAGEHIASYDKNINMTIKNYNNEDDLMEHPEFNYFKTHNNDSEESLKRGIVQETKTPPCTPKKVKKDDTTELDYENEEALTFSKETTKNLENNNTAGVSNYFIDASTLIDDDEIYTPPISLVNFKSIQNSEDNNLNAKSQREEQLDQSNTVTPTFFSPETQMNQKKEKEKQQGEIIFKSSISNFSEHEVDGNEVLSAERLRGGADHFNKDEFDDYSEQVFPFGTTLFDSTTNSPNFQSGPNTNFSIEGAYIEPCKLSEDYELDSKNGGNVINPEFCENFSENGSIDSYNTSVCSESSNFIQKNECTPIISGNIDFVDDRKKKIRTPSQSHGEAWVVMFDDNKKPKTGFLSNSESGLEGESGDERENLPLYKSSYESNRSLPPTELFCDVNKIDPSTNKKQAYPIEKSSSFGYFLDFGKENNNNNNDNDNDESMQKESEFKTKEVKKNNMFSMFIGIDDNSKSTCKKIKPVLEKNKTFDKSTDENFTEVNLTTPDETSNKEENKKPFFMFIESDSPIAKRKQPIKKISKLSPKLECLENKKTERKNFEYNFEEKKKDEEEVKVDCNHSSIENNSSFLKSNSNFSRSTKGKLPLPLNKYRDIKSENSEPKITGWGETKGVTKDVEPTSESWLKTCGVHINYKEKSDNSRNDLCLTKDSTFVLEENKRKQSKSLLNIGSEVDEKNLDSFVKLSDMDISKTFPKKKCSDKMSQSISETTSKNSVPVNDIPLSRSIGSEVEKKNLRKTDLYSKQVNKSLTRLFPNLSVQSLASLSRKNGDIHDNEYHASQLSEASSSLQSSVEPLGLEISTSETDVSSQMESSSRLGEDLLKMFLEEIGPDIVVEVGGRRIKAHKCILSSRCQYFAAMLSGGWVESAGNVISLQGFSYNSVHFALRYIYSGDSRIPESNIVELATLADTLCLDGLQEIISHNLKVKYCHCFHVPCSGCSIGVIDCLSIAATCGLDDLYRKCLRWITKYFVKIWPTESFGSLPKELLEKCYQHNIVHMTVDNVLDTLVNIEKVKGFLPSVRWAENVSRLINKLKGATVRYIAEHFSSVLTSDNFLALGKEADWNLSLLEDSLIESIKYLPPEQACWSHARLHRILSATSGPDVPPEMDWNENFYKLLNIIAELVENNLIKQAPRASKSKAWKQMEPELRSRIQEAACLILPNEDASPVSRRPFNIKKDSTNPVIQPTAKSRNLEIRQIKLAMTYQNTYVPQANRPLSLQIDQRTKKDSRFIPLRSSLSTSSVRKAEPIEGIRKTQSRSHILGNLSEPKKISVNPRYAEVKSRYLETKSSKKSAPDKQTSNSNPKKNIRCVSSSDSSRNCSPALRPSNSKVSISKRAAWNNQHNRDPIMKSESSSAVIYKRDQSFTSTKSETTVGKTLNRLNSEKNMSTDSLCTNSLISEKEATFNKRPDDIQSRTLGKENLMGKRKIGSWGSAPKSKSTTSSPTTRRLNTENVSVSAKTSASQKFIIPNSKIPTDTKSRYFTGKGNTIKGNSYKSNTSSPKTTTYRNQKNSTQINSNVINANSSRKRSDVDSENNKKQSKIESGTPSAVSRSGTFLKDEPTILKRPTVKTTNGRL